MRDTRSRSALTAAARDFLSTDLLAIDAAVGRKLDALLQAVVDGELDAAALQAAFGVERADPAPSPRGGVAIVSLVGVLTASESIFTWLGLGTSMRAFMRDLTAAAADTSVKTIVVDADSPGGSVQLIPEAAALVRATRKVKPVVVACSGLLCSAAYWTVAGSTRIAATPSARVGSIGVFASRLSLARHLEREGVDVDLIASAPAKTWGHEATRMSDDERAYLQQQVDETNAAFEGDVATGRGIERAIVRRDFGQGRCFSAARALAAHMIDAVETVDVTLAGIVAAPTLAERRLATAQAALARPRAALMRAALAGPRAALEERRRHGKQVDHLV